MRETARTVLDVVRAETRAFISGGLDPVWNDATVVRAAIDLTREGDAHAGLALLEGYVHGRARMVR